MDDYYILDDDKYKQLRQHLEQSISSDYSDFYTSSIALELEAYIDKKQNKNHSEYLDYELAIGDALRAHYLYVICKNYDLDGTDKYRSTLWSLSSALHSKAKEILESVPKKRSKGRPPANEIYSLINTVADIYEGLRIRKGQHFIGTIQLIVDFADYPCGDIKSLIKRATGSKKYHRLYKPLEEY